MPSDPLPLSLSLALKKKEREEGATMIGRPPVSPINDGNDPFSGFNKQGRPKRPKGKKITKSDIGLPSDFRYFFFQHRNYSINLNENLSI